MTKSKLDKAANIVKNAHDLAKTWIKVGVNLLDLNQKIADYIAAQGAEPAPIKMYNFPYATCISINHEACHGMPRDHVITSEDLINLDISLYYDGWYADAARCHYLGNDPIKLGLIKFAITHFNRITSEPLTYLEELGLKMYDACKTHGYACIVEYGGHYIGTSLHLRPFVPSMIANNDEKKTMINTGDTFCFEPIITTSTNGATKAMTTKSNTYDDKWTVFTLRKTPCVHLENTFIYDGTKLVSLTGSIPIPS